MTVSKVSTRDRDEFVWTLAKEGVTIQAIRSCLRYASQIQRHAVEACNRETSAEENNKDSRRCANLRTLLSPWGIKVHTQGDPRGACVKLKLKSGRSNDFGGEGYFCVPTPGW